jgi:hypothetical protein
MQRLCQVSGGVKAYLENPSCLVNENTRECPFCPDRHFLRLHAWYFRTALLLGSISEKIPVRRLLCSRTGKTVSLLPDFCIPKRQHGPDILGVFLFEFMKGLSLLEAFKLARAEAPCHSMAQSLRNGFLRRKKELKCYLATLFPRAMELPEEIPKDRRLLSQLVLPLTEGFSDAGVAFTHHGYFFHRSFELGLA